MSSWWEENMLNVIPQINSQFDMRSTSTCVVVYHFFTICHRKKMAINYRKSKKKFHSLKEIDIVLICDANL